MIPSLKTTTALAFELRQRGLAVRVDLQHQGNAADSDSAEWVVWLFSSREPMILHVVKHAELACALELAIAEYDDEQGEDHDDGSEVIQ